jgi:tripartite-type tricarboxylate transporter receptor subunit TctC
MRARLAFIIGAILGWNTPAHAQTVAEFYRGKSVQMLIAYTPGGGYDLHARVLARHLGKHIPGNPTVVPQNFAGAAGLRLANFVFNAAPKDGATMGLFARGSSTAPLLSSEGVQFDSRRYTWIGSVSDEVSLCVSWHTSNVKTFDDLLTMPFVAGAQGTVSDAHIFTNMLRSVFGAKLRLVPGYPGTNELSLAMERGEVEGRCGWAWGSIKLSRPDWLAAKRINLLMQLSLQRADDLPDLPLITDRARNDRERKILQLIFSRQQMAWPFAAPPDIPHDRAAALRAAFDATVKDPEYLAEAKQRLLEVNPMSGLAMEKLIRELYDTPADVIAATKAAITEK